MQKLVLVPQEEWEKLKNKNSKDTKQVVTVKHPVANPLPQNIPQNPPQKRVQKEVQNPQKKMQNPPQKKVQNPPQNKTEKQNGKLIKSINKFPRLYRDRGLSLLRYMKRNDDIKWNEKGEFQYQDKTVPKSNILSLMKHAVSNSKSKPKGVKIFYKVMSRLNVPKFIIVNKMGRALMKKSAQKKDDSFRPPGKLQK